MRGTNSNGVFKTVDKGATWIPTRNPITLLPVISRKGLVGSADFDGAGVAGGEIVSFFAINVGPDVGVSAQFRSQDGKASHDPGGCACFLQRHPSQHVFRAERTD